MELTDEFEVPLEVADAWALLTDLPRVARSLPGAQLDEVEGEEYRGRVRVKVGPIGLEYRGVARFLSQDPAAHVAELRAEGRESRGQGNAAATVRSQLIASGDGRTRVEVSTTLEISGRLAQFGRGALADVSRKLLRQFVDNLQVDLSSTGSAGSAGSAGSGSPGAVPTAAPDVPGGPRGSTPDGSAAAGTRDAGTTPGDPDRRPAATSEPTVAGVGGDGPPGGSDPIRAVRLLAPVAAKRVVPPLLLLAAAAALWRRLGRRERAGRVRTARRLRWQPAPTRNGKRSKTC